MLPPDCEGSAEALTNQRLKVAKRKRKVLKINVLLSRDSEILDREASCVDKVNYCTLIRGQWVQGVPLLPDTDDKKRLTQKMVKTREIMRACVH